MPNNTRLNISQKNKKDEFRTIMPTIEKEMPFYEDFFRDKIVYCNCDDEESNFVKYFKNNKDRLGIKELLYTSLGGGVDFRSEKSIELLKRCDVVVTNPPFSLFREYIQQLFDYDKKFLIIGNQNALTYKNIFPYARDNKLWFGNSIHSGDIEFLVPKDYPIETQNHRIDEEGNVYLRVTGVRWYTNIQRPELPPFKFTCEYNPTVHPMYDEIDYIEVSKTKNIPSDYKGIMGVPITFFDKYNPSEFKILDYGSFHLNGKQTYKRFFIKRIFDSAAD